MGRNRIEKKGSLLAVGKAIGAFLFLMVIGCGGGGGGSSSSETAPTYTVSGTISAAVNVMVDSDVNDINAAAIPNNTIYDAQEISSPVTLGGFVNTPGTGDEAGNFYEDGDVDDYFRVFLEAGDSLSLILAEETADLDLFLYDETGSLEDSSTGTAISEFLTVSTGGTYLVRVTADSGASNYTLSIGRHGSDAALSGLKLSSDFVPGEVIVQFRESGGVSSSGFGLKEQAAAMGMTLRSGAPNRAVLFEFSADDDRTAVFNALDVAPSPVEDQIPDAETESKMNTLRVIKELRKRSDVLYAEPNYYVHSMAVPDDELYPVQWNFPMIHLPEAWDITTGSSDVTVAVVDTGILMNHPDLQAQLTSDGYDFIIKTDISLDGDGLDDDPADPGDLLYGSYSSFHGTHCAGIAAATSNNTVGVSGAAWNTRIMPVRVLGKNGTGTLYDTYQGVLYAAGLPNDSGRLPEIPADIISLSLGGGNGTDQGQAVFNQVRSKGIIVVAAAGNKNAAQVDFPAAYNGVIAVSAVNITGSLASYSNTGSAVDVSAPGGDGSTDINHDGVPDGVMSTWGDDSSGTVRYRYSTKSGTSMATPHVAGVVALMKAVKPDLTPDEFDFYLENFSIVSDIGAVGRDNDYGYGLIDAYKAVAVAQTGFAGATLKITPQVFDFGLLATSVPITAVKVGDPSLNVRVTGVTENADWLAVTEPASTDGLGTYIVAVDRTGLSDGVYSAVITFAGSVDSVPVEIQAQIYLQMNSAGVIPDSGLHYVLLVTSDTLAPVMADRVSAVNGQYSYSFEGVPEAGRYKIFAGTDRDSNGIINNYGESFGAYGSVDTPVEITVTEHMTGLDFGTELRLSLPADSSLLYLLPGLSINESDFKRIKN